MMFDTLIRIAERHDAPKEIREVLERVRLFVFPGRAHDVLPDKFDPDDIEFFRDNFFLPFRYMAIEDTASCIVLWDTEKDARGVFIKRNFIECLVLRRGGSAEFEDGGNDAGAFERMAVEFPPQTATIAKGWVKHRTFEDTAEWLIEGNTTLAFVASPDKLIIPSERMEESRSEVNASAIRNVGAALQEIMYFNSPERFIMEKRPMRGKHQKKRKKMLRSHERPIYTLLRPKEIRQQMHLAEPQNGGGVKPHERRAHSRTFRSDKFVKMKGKTIIIPATWIGPSQASYDGHRFKVLLDK